MTRRGELVTVECTKQRSGPETLPFEVKLSEPQGKDGPKELQFVRFRQALTPVETEEVRAQEALGAYAEGLTDVVVPTSDITKHLQAQGFSKRTAERVLHKYGPNYLDHVTKGRWRRKRMVA